jgi:hypothetical protein
MSDRIAVGSKVVTKFSTEITPVALARAPFSATARRQKRWFAEKGCTPQQRFLL